MEVYKECCKNCLLSPDSIVSPKRRKEIIQTCATQQTHFICHKATMEGKDICCKSFYDKLGHVSQLVRISQRLNMVKFIEQPESEKLPTHSEMELPTHNHPLQQQMKKFIYLHKFFVSESKKFIGIPKDNKNKSYPIWGENKWWRRFDKNEHEMYKYTIIDIGYEKKYVYRFKDLLYYPIAYIKFMYYSFNNQ